MQEQCWRCGKGISPDRLAPGWMFDTCDWRFLYWKFALMAGRVLVLRPQNAIKRAGL
ncbi:MAG: hypothetical protein KatS3mg005_0499 [Bryobacteraceae bacterium]|nr:MAG: hypothetical protein KatS3mg005_0499 [Bryobacteraceae bacterium]